MRKINIACIIDDDPAYIFVTKKYMKMVDFCENILIFNNGKLALEGLKGIMNAKEALPEVILLDINMPVMDGWEFLDEFTQIDTASKITIYIVSSSVDPDDVLRAREYSELTNYIVKPVEVEKLKQILFDYNLQLG